MFVKSLIKNNVYYDSLILMQLNNMLLKQQGVLRALVMMGTNENRASIRDQKLLTNEVRSALPNDLFIIVEAENNEACKYAIDYAIDYLENKRSDEKQGTAHYKTLDAAVQNTLGANLVSVSLPGKYAYAEARRALESDLHVFLFSDNVPLQEEIKLKQLATDRNKIVMGPDCGTAIIGGASLGFANAVRRGSIGIVGAAGTGIQEVASLIHRMGGGISHAIGTGGRDVSESVNGVTLLAGLKWLANDPHTKIIVIVSKPPAQKVKENILKMVHHIQKPVVVNLTGVTEMEYQTGMGFVVETMEDAAKLAFALERGELPTLYQHKYHRKLIEEEHKKLKPEQSCYRGLFSGGTFANEAAMLLNKHHIEVYGNISLPGILPLVDPFESIGHTCVDMGEDIFTVGKPHPILEPSLRRERIIAEANDTSTGVLFLDIVLGYGCHPNPSAEFSQYIREAKEVAARNGRYLPVVVNITGVNEDPQDYSKQVDILQQVDALIAPTNASATLMAIGILTGKLPDANPLSISPINEGALTKNVLPFELPAHANVINLGLSIFAESLEMQHIPVIHVDFQPPAGGDEKLTELLSDLI